jgi:LysR family transcriptional regulator, glycine cleavage system transcriptional activator
MSERRRHLPPTSALHTLVTVAHTGGFSRAAHELDLTQSAVSRQIATLEDWLGEPLFDRRGRRVALNARGRAYVEAVEPALRALRRATAAITDRPSERVVELAVLPSFGMRWLAPRLARLSERWPDLVVNFAARIDEFDFADERFDAAIHAGAANWPGGDHTLLFEEAMTPVVAPSRLSARSVRSAGDLLQHPLLHQAARPHAWRDWFAAHGVEAGEVARAGPSFAHFLMMAQAAVAGAGVALMPRFLVEDELRSGQLADPLGITTPSGASYWFVTPQGRPLTTGVRDLKAWLLEEAGRPP